MQIAGYEIERCLAEGSSASAYLAIQISLARPVVLKVLDTALAGPPQALQRFLNEGRLIASLRHPNIVTVHDIGTAGRYVYIAMEYVEGGDLKQRLTQGPLTVDVTFDIIEKIADGLGYAHAHGVVHRDVKPGNILFRRDGTPVLSDFGIAKSPGNDGDLTSTGIFLGSPNYMAPEQVDSRTVDNGADIYALGIIFYEMLTGQKPFLSTSIIDVIYMHKKAPMPRLPARYEPLQGFLDLMVAKSRSDRFRDIAALQHYLDTLRQRGLVAALAADGAAPARVEPPAVSAAVPSRRRVKRGLAAGLLLAASAYGALFIVERRLASPAASNAIIEANLAAPAATALPTAGAGPPAIVATDEVISALLWLGQHSVNEYRLTSPPQDNAFYYFSRLRQLAPDHPGVASGFRSIAGAYAVLAERDIAAGNLDRARRYIGLARGIDPANEALPLLSELVVPARLSVWAKLTGWLH